MAPGGTSPGGSQVQLDAAALNGMLEQELDGLLEECKKLDGFGAQLTSLLLAL